MPDNGTELAALDLGHILVHENELMAKIGKRIQNLHRIAERHGFHAGMLQQGGIKLRNLFVTVYNQNTERFFFLRFDQKVVLTRSSGLNGRTKNALAPTRIYSRRVLRS